MSEKCGVIYCNRCGKRICTQQDEGKIEFLRIKKRWGYFSENKDGKIYRVELCERCCEEMLAEFLIPPDICEATEFL